MYIQVTVVTRSCIFVVGGDVQFKARLDGDVLVPRSVSCSDLGTFLLWLVSKALQLSGRSTYRVEGNGHRTAWIVLGRLSGIFNDRFVVLFRVSVLG